MGKFIKLGSLFFVIFLSGCSSMSDHEFMLAQGEDPDEQTFNAHIREWQKLKPEIYELVKMKKELKSLINDLNELADETEKELLANKSKSEFSDQETIRPMSKQVVMPNTSPVNSMIKSSAIDAETIEDKTTEQESSNITEGQFAIQLGSFSNMIYVKRTWKKVKAAYPLLLANKTPLSEPVQLANDRTLFRLKVGSYTTKADAKEICEVLIAKQQNCIATSLSGKEF